MPESPGTHAEPHAVAQTWHSGGSVVGCLCACGLEMDIREHTDHVIAALSADLEAVTRERDEARRDVETVGEDVVHYARLLMAAEQRLEATKDALRLLGGVHPEKVGDWEFAAKSPDREAQMRAFARAALAEDK